MTAQPPAARWITSHASYTLHDTPESFGTCYDEAVPKAIRTNCFAKDCLKFFGTGAETVRFASDVSAPLAEGRVQPSKETRDSPKISGTFVGCGANSTAEVTTMIPVWVP